VHRKQIPAAIDADRVINAHVADSGFRTAAVQRFSVCGCVGFFQVI